MVSFDKYQELDNEVRACYVLAVARKVEDGLIWTVDGERVAFYNGEKLTIKKITHYG